MFQRRNIVFIAILSALGGCATQSGPVSVTETIANTPTLSTLNQLVTSAGLAETLKGAGPFTVFAPTNDAFKAVPAKTMEALGKDPALLKEVLTYHVTSGKLLAADLKNNDKLKTLNGAEIVVSKAGDFVTVEDGVVQAANLNASNGVVHAIDVVLTPPKKK